MSDQKPRMWPAILTAGLLLLAGLTMITVGVIGLSGAAIGLALVIWLLLPLLGLPLILWSANHLYGLLSANYRIDRDGFSLQWGMALESAPLSKVRSVDLVAAADLPMTPPLSMPGFLLGDEVEAGFRLEFFAIAQDKLVLVELDRCRLVLAPQDPEGFVQAFQSATRMGSLNPLSEHSHRANLLPSRLWQDTWARWLLLAGLALPVALIAYLGIIAGQLPAQVPFGFDTSGAPGPAAPVGRLLLLAVVNGLVWVINFLSGAWFYSSLSRRPLSYTLWGLSLLVGVLFWGAVLQMLEAAQ